MLRLSGRLDPMSGLLLHNHIQAMIAALFAERVPSTCPTDPSDKQDHLRALALLALINGRRVPTTQTAAPSNDETGEWDEFADALLGETARLGRPEFVILVDTTNLDDGKPIVDWGIPVTVPWSRIQGFVRRAKLRPVVIHNGAVIDADGELTIDLPHGQIMQTGPPERKAAA